MELLLEKNEILDFGRGRLKGYELLCLAGRCWLTQEGDSRDHLLAAGERFTSRSRGRVLVTAISGCRLTLVDAAAQQTCGERFFQPLSVKG
ncbi:MAG: hypothetical protein C0622_00605 [Desulfuromonas sp.]|nr:MAG: hypothetical protein C0622_00605 [Desulfuromonas sp.]